MNYAKPKIIGICGGSASGKTTLARLLQEKIGKDACAIICMDNFYYDFVSRGYDPARINYDHPDSFDIKALRGVLKKLRVGKVSQLPVYDFKTHTRLKETIQLTAPSRIIVDGLFLYNIRELEGCFSLKLFVDTPDDIRLHRRLERDRKERGRSEDSVRSRFRDTVLPMHQKFVLDNRRLADLVVPGDKPFTSRIRQLLDLMQ